MPNIWGENYIWEEERGRRNKKGGRVSTRSSLIFIYIYIVEKPKWIKKRYVCIQRMRDREQRKQNIGI